MKGLEIRDLEIDEIPFVAWSGSPTHLSYVRDAVTRTVEGKVDFLTAIIDGEHVGIGGVDYAPRPGSGKLWMLEVKEDHRSHGVGAALIAEMETRIRKRDVPLAWLMVEDYNVRARALYERLGYEVTDEATESWTREDESGNLSTYTANGFVMQKQLGNGL